MAKTSRYFLSKQNCTWLVLSNAWIWCLENSVSALLGVSSVKCAKTGLNPGFAPDWMCDLEQVTSPLCTSVGLFLSFLAVLGLCCCSWAFSSCSKQGLLFSCSVLASHRSGFSCCRTWALELEGSVVVAHGLSCSVSCGIFPDQGSNLHPLLWQADS